MIDILTGDDYLADGNTGLMHVRNLPDHIDPSQLAFADSELAPLPTLYPIASDRVRYVGEIVAVVVARTEAMALDAVELITDYRRLCLQ